MEKRLTVSGVILLTAITCALTVSAVLAPAVWSTHRSEAESLAAEASMLAECALERALCEVMETGECQLAAKEVRCGGDGDREPSFVRRTTVTREKPAGAFSVAVSVTWHSAAGSGKVVARGTCRAASFAGVR